MPIREPGFTSSGKQNSKSSPETTAVESAEDQKDKSDGTLLKETLRIMANIVEQATDHALLEYDSDKLDRLKDIRSILVVGPSGAGKTTLVDVAREFISSSDEKDTFFTVPKRIVSRPQRANDNLVENDFAVTAEEFDEKTRDGIRWQRKMDLEEAGKIEHYGFEAVHGSSIPIYSANLAFLSKDAHLTGVEPDFFEHTLVVYISARSHIRHDRLVERSPDIMLEKPDEAAMRLAGDTESIFDQAHISLRTRNIESERELYADTISVLLSAIRKIKEGSNDQVIE